MIKQEIKQQLYVWSTFCMRGQLFVTFSNSDFLNVHKSPKAMA